MSTPEFPTLIDASGPRHDGRWMLVAGALLAAFAVGLGAFGAHALEATSPDRARAWNTGVEYHLAHAVALVLFGVLQRTTTRDLTLAAGLLTAGIALFSGPLYLYVLTGETAWGAVPPLGGISFMVAWGWLAYAMWRPNSRAG